MTRDQLRLYRLYMKLSHSDMALMLGNVPAPVTATDMAAMESGARAIDTRVDERFRLPPHIALAAAP